MEEQKKQERQQLYQTLEQLNGYLNEVVKVYEAGSIDLYPKIKMEDAKNYEEGIRRVRHAMTSMLGVR